MVPPGRLELPRPCGQQILSLPRLPIPPQGPMRRPGRRGSCPQAGPGRPHDRAGLRRVNGAHGGQARARGMARRHPVARDAAHRSTAPGTAPDIAPRTAPPWRPYGAKGRAGHAAQTAGCPGARGRGAFRGARGRLQPGGVSVRPGRPVGAAAHPPVTRPAPCPPCCPACTRR